MELDIDYFFRLANKFDWRYRSDKTKQYHKTIGIVLSQEMMRYLTKGMQTHHRTFERCHHWFI